MCQSDFTFDFCFLAFVKSLAEIWKKKKCWWKFIFTGKSIAAYLGKSEYMWTTRLTHPSSHTFQTLLLSEFCLCDFFSLSFIITPSPTYKRRMNPHIQCTHASPCTLVCTHTHYLQRGPGWSLHHAWASHSLAVLGHFSSERSRQVRDSVSRYSTNDFNRRTAYHKMLDNWHTRNDLMRPTHLSALGRAHTYIYDHTRACI